jgi:quercetin dioxygenase-like cupin family protein
MRTRIVGGTSQRVAKGDFMLVPQGVPHWFSAVDGSVTLMSLHLRASRRTVKVRAAYR